MTDQTGNEIIPDDAYRPTLPDDAWSLGEYLRTLRVGPIRELAAHGMPLRHESKKAEMIEWLVRYAPEVVRRQREDAATKWCPYAGCDFSGTDDQVDGHRAESHRDEAQQGSNLNQRRV